MGPKTEQACKLHAEKYRGKGEDFRGYANRVAGRLKDNDQHFRAFREILIEQRFLPGGRIQSAIGSTRYVTSLNCYVSGTIEDSMVDGVGSIMNRATEAAATLRLGGGIGYDFSTIRPNGDLIKKLESNATGPVSFMGIYEAVCATIASAGHRRGAQMGMLRCDHPDIEEFINAKRNSESLKRFNISVAVTDEFMECLLNDKPFKLRFNGTVYREVDPRSLWETIMRSTWDWAEPGVIFIDTINRMNNLWYCEKIAATNPCAEQPLPPHGACLLGSINLTKFVSGPGSAFDWVTLRRDIPHIVRAMDNVIDAAIFPLYEQEKEAKSKRRMGLGVTGLANTLETMGYKYGTPEFLEKQDYILAFINDACYVESIELAMEKGSFRMFDAQAYPKSAFIRDRIPHLVPDITKHGIRNSHLTSVAPTGTISMAADNVSSGIEPVFMNRLERKINMPQGMITEVLEDYAYREWGIVGTESREVKVDDHINVLAIAAKNVDSAVSKTCNVAADTPWEDFKDIYKIAWELGIKGIATYTEVSEDGSGGKRQGIMSEVTEEKACVFDPETGKKTCDE